MLQGKSHEILKSFLIYGSLFLSNASAFYSLIWLFPELVFLETAFWLILAMISIWMFSRHQLLSGFAATLPSKWMIFPFLFFSGVSIFWSVEWGVSLSRWLILLLIMIVGGYVGLRYDLKQIVKFLSVFCAFILFLSTLLVLLVPYVGVMNYYTIQGAWKGIYWHKNHMGLIAAFANILFLIDVIGSLRLRAKSVWWWGGLYLFSLLFVYETDSAAAFITLIVLHGVTLLSLAYLKFRAKLQGYHYAILFVVLILAFLGVFTNMDRVLNIFNRSPTLTGRVPMWGQLFDIYLSQRPLAGYGFNAFWYIGAHRVTMQQAAGYPDPIVISDNGFIDILINTGYCGLALFLIFYFGLWVKSIRHARNADDVYGLFPVILMSYTLLANISWSLIFENESFFMLIMISLMFSLSRTSLFDAQLQR
jgi:O-antigen ligase